MIEFKLLRPDDVDRQILDILDILTETKYLSITQAKVIIYYQLRHNHFTYVGYICGSPVCMGSLVILAKLGRNGGRSGLIEDVAVKPEFQGRGYGRQLIEFLKTKAESYNVYKTFLNCSDDKQIFYEKCGFKKQSVQMRIDY